MLVNYTIASSDTEEDGDTGQSDGEWFSHKIQYHHTDHRPPVKEGNRER